MVTTAPDEFSAYISVGTVTDYARADVLKYEFLEKAVAHSGNEEFAAGLRNLGPPPYRDFSKVILLGRLLWNYGGTFKSLEPEAITAAVMKTKEYSEKELEQQGMAMEKLHGFYENYLHQYRADQIASRINTPTIFVHGRYDMAAPIGLTKHYFDRVAAPSGKNWVEFDHSAHFPMYEEPAKFLKVLLRSTDAAD